jgi:hypothetical protein
MRPVLRTSTQYPVLSTEYSVPRLVVLAIYLLAHRNAWK